MPWRWCVSRKQTSYLLTVKNDSEYFLRYATNIDWKKIKMKSGHEKGNTVTGIENTERWSHWRKTSCVPASNVLKGDKISKRECPEDNCGHVTEDHEKAGLEKKYGVRHVEAIAEVSRSKSVWREKMK